MEMSAADLADCLGRAYDSTRDPGKRDDYHAVTTSDRSRYIITESSSGGALMWIMYQGELYQVNVTRQATIRNTFPPRAACGSTRPHDPHERNTAVPLTDRHCPGLREEPA
jgi:hypothetical protein